MTDLINDIYTRALNGLKPVIDAQKNLSVEISKQVAILEDKGCDADGEFSIRVKSHANEVISNLEFWKYRLNSVFKRKETKIDRAEEHG